MTEANDSLLSSDKPLTDPENDRLGYSPFAERLAESLLAMAPADGFVVALYGSWGSGKTTVVNFIVRYLECRPEEDQPIIVHFNPWWFSGRENLIRAFFDQLQGGLDRALEIRLAQDTAPPRSVCRASFRSADSLRLDGEGAQESH